jgi:signal transduction histidine kinase/ligand-binding sensor domain-containing protein/DNA-binding response OmpR family regulator
MFKSNFFGYLGLFCIAFFILSQIKPDIFPQSKEKITNWPEPVFEHLTIADGLPENSVRCILQDHLGYMWFGTQNGLVKYDGYSMKVYQPDPDDSLSISDRQIYSIYEDRSGTMWIGTEHEDLNRFDRATEKFTRYRLNPDDSMREYPIGEICEDSSGNLLVGAFGGLNLFNTNTEKFKRINYRGSVYSPAVYKYILSLVARRKRIGSILKVGDNANSIKIFTINKKTVVITVIMGEAGFDDGWLESTNGKIIAGQNNANAVYAGGHISNLIQIEIDTLDRGSYKLRYVSDAAWSYNEWRNSPPDFPGFWGIQVIELPDDQKSVREIFNKIKTSTLDYSVFSIKEDRSTGNIYVGGNGKIFIYDRNKQCLLDFNRISRLKLNMGEIHSFHQSSNGTLWIGHSMGLSRFNSMDNSLKLYQPVSSVFYTPENDIRNLTEDKNGFIWGRIGRGDKGDGLICFDSKKKQFKMYVHIQGKVGSLSSNKVMSVYKDHSGVLWVGTGWAGLNKWDRNNDKFKRFSYGFDGEPFNIVYTVTEDNRGIIWFGTDNGLYSFNRHSNKFQNFRYDSSNKNNYVYYIYIDEAGIIWFTTYSRGLGRFDREKRSFNFYSNNPDDSMSISSNSADLIIPDSGNVLWISTWGDGLNRFDKRTGKFIRFKHDPGNPRSVSSNSIGCLYIDRRGNLWIGTNGRRLNLFDRTNRSFESFKIEEDKTTAVPVIYEDHKENFWVGTYQTGLYLFDRDKGTSVYNISAKDGLSNNDVESVLEDESGNLWIGTGYGLSKFDPETHRIRNYYTSNVFDENQYVDGSVCKTSTGEMLFGTWDGFIMFNPDSIKDDPVPPQVVISNVSLFNKPGEKLEIDGFISELKELDLSYDENDLRFDYVGLHYGNPLKNRYKYKLEGFDKEWVDAGTQRNATYTNLNAGEYTFKVTACNEDGVWNEEGASIKIIIPPPFWAKWWAYSLYILFGMALLYILRRYELNRTNLKNQVKLDEVKLKEREETDRMKSRFFANISHEFRTPLTLILGPTEKVLTASKDNETQKQLSIVKRSADRLLSLINQLLDLSKLEAGKLELNASKGNIVSFINGITMSFESVAERKDILLKVKAGKNEIDLYFDKEKMTKIMTNLLSNAFKFTENGGKITVKINEKDNSFIEIKVKDTGIGISEEELPRLFDRFYQVDSSQTREYEGTGLGLALTKELVELHRGTIRVKSNSGVGSEFIIELPLGRKHLKEEEIIEDEITSEDATMIDSDLREFESSHFEKLSVIKKDNDLSEDKNIILIVEDNADVREFIKDSIGDEYETKEASNGEQGLRKAVKFIPDLIISDIMMPKMDGNELTRRIKNDEKTSHIPVILLTAKSEQESRLEGLETGADDYLIKPFDSKELRIRIKNLIDIRRKLQEKFAGGRILQRKGEKKLSNLDENFLRKVLETVERHLSEEDFSIEQFGEEVGMSRQQLNRKIKALTGKSASLHLRSIRLAKAKLMITEKLGNISEIAYSVGFSSPAYFTACFKEEFGCPPSEVSK